MSLAPGGLADIGEFAGRTFDYHADHPELARLLQWEGLAGGPAADEINRTEHYQQKVKVFAAAQRDGVLDDGLDPAYVVFMLIALAAWWSSVPQLAWMLTGADPDDPAERARRRAFVVHAAQRLAAPADHPGSRRRINGRTGPQRRSGPPSAFRRTFFTLWLVADSNSTPGTSWTVTVGAGTDTASAPINRAATAGLHPE